MGIFYDILGYEYVFEEHPFKGWAFCHGSRHVCHDLQIFFDSQWVAKTNLDPSHGDILEYVLILRSIQLRAGPFARGLDMFAITPTYYFDISMGSKNQPRPITWEYFGICVDFGGHPAKG